MNRILIDTPTFQTILDKHPQIEVELLNTVVPQLAETVRKKVEEREGNWTTQIQKAIGRLESDLGSRWKFPEAAKGVIRLVLKEELQKDIKVYAKDEAEKEARAVIGKVMETELKKLREAAEIDAARLEARIDAYAKTAAERETLALIRGVKTS